GRDAFRTCPMWIKRATGNPDASLLGLLTSEGKTDHVQYWMPDNGTTWTKASWEAKYKKHVEGLIECCEAVGRGPTHLPSGCKANCPDQPTGTCPADRWTP